MNDNLIVSVSPHYHKKGASTQRVMLDVIIALLPALIASCVIFGARSLLLVAVSAANCVLLEFLWNKLMKKEQTVGDLSAVVTGILIAFNVPVSMPIWELLVGDFIAVVIVKMLFGGLGCNFVNPALVGRVSMMLSFTTDMTSYNCAVSKIEALTSATPLTMIDGVSSATSYTLQIKDLGTLLLGQHGGVLGETCAIALLLGGIYLVVRGVIKPTIPLSFLASLFVFTFLFNGFIASSALFSLFAGGAMLGSIFMATDYVTSPITPKGMLIFGAGCGFLTACIRLFASSSEGVSFAILIMNLLVPYINGWTKTKPVGGVAAK